MATADPVTLSAGASSYEWVDDWARIPDTDSARRGWAHTEVVFTSDGELLTGHPGQPTVLVLDPEGNLVRSSGTTIWYPASSPLRTASRSTPREVFTCASS